MCNKVKDKFSQSVLSIGQTISLLQYLIILFNAFFTKHAMYARSVYQNKVRTLVVIINCIFYIYR